MGDRPGLVVGLVNLPAPAENHHAINGKIHHISMVLPLGSSSATTRRCPRAAWLWPWAKWHNATRKRRAEELGEVAMVKTNGKTMGKPRENGDLYGI